MRVARRVGTEEEEEGEDFNIEEEGEDFNIYLGTFTNLLTKYSTGNSYSAERHLAILLVAGDFIASKRE